MSRVVLGPHTLDLAGRPALMAILNVTPDSFSDGGRFMALEAALAQARALIASGADILDIGGESTRPGSNAVGADEECARVLPVITALVRECRIPISIDTTKAMVAEAALSAGATLVNDISGGIFEPEIMRVAARHGAGFVLMHTSGPPKTMQQNVHYDDVVADVEAFFVAALQRAEEAGLARDHLILDAGIGFGKSVEHNLALINASGRFACLGCPVLVGASRKSFIGALSEAPLNERLPGSLAAAGLAVLQGARLLRVHDILETRRFLAVFEAGLKTRALA